MICAQNFLIFVILISGYFVNQSNAIICYECTSCAEPFPSNSNLNVSCGSGYDTCLKSTIRYPGGAYIAKSCVSSALCKESNINIAGYGFWLNCCTSDYCNMDTRLLPHKTIIAIVALISVLIQKSFY